MNIDNLKLLRDTIANSQAFDMGDWPHIDKSDAEYIAGGHYCGTPVCIGGHGEALIRVSGERPDDSSISVKDVGGWLGLSGKKFNALFFPRREDAGIDMLDITQAQAIRCLDHLIETGEVDWRAAE